MKKLLVALLVLPSLCGAEQLKAQFNACTGCPDYYTRLDSGTLPSGSTQYIQNGNSLQSGATFYVSSGTVAGQLSVIGSITIGGTTSYYATSSSTTATNAAYDLAVWSATSTLIDENSGGVANLPGGLNVTYGVAVGSMTGGGLSACGDSTHGLGWTSTNNKFTCQNITGSGVAVYTGSSTVLVTQVSSPTAIINFNNTQFSGSLQGGSTAFISISYSTSTPTSSYVATSTDSVIMANCAAACTVTLPTAVGISGKVYFVKILGSGTVTIATSGGQTIDGSSTVTPSPNQYAEIEVISDGSNFEIL